MTAFAVPNWAWHEHINRSKSEEAILFSVNDIPIVEAFDLYREEPENSLHTTQAPQVPASKQDNGRSNRSNVHVV